MTAIRRTAVLMMTLLSPATIAALVGLALTSYGLGTMYEPLAYIVPGCLLLAFGLWLAGAFQRRGG